jgi:hypothetical protein
MGYFTNMAAAAFGSDGEGRKLFSPWGLFARSYYIPDTVSEGRLFRKLTWYYRISLFAVFIPTPFLFRHFLRQPWLFLGSLALVTSASWLAMFIVLHSDLESLQRAPSRPSLRLLYTRVAQRRTQRGLILGLLSSIVFVVLGACMCSEGGFPFAWRVSAVVFFGACAIACGYMLYLKQTSK